MNGGGKIQKIWYNVPFSKHYKKGTIVKHSEDYNLKVIYPKLAKQWHPSKNDVLRPEDVPPRAFVHAWWQCRRGHEWVATVSERSNGAGCPLCKPGRGKASETYNLEVLFPEAARLWHPTQNFGLTPGQVPPGAARKVWWKCENGHEWNASVVSLRNRPLCPRCYQKKATPQYNFAAAHPDLAKEWHPTKNGDLLPSQIPPGAGQKVWWQCKHGHEWQARVLHRHRGNCKCPYCSGRKPTKENNFAVVQPDAAGLWHPDKNGDRVPSQFTPRSPKEVWWKCGHGHEWKMSVNDMNRIHRCPYCTGVRMSDVYNLQYDNPELAKQWHPHKNGDLNPDKVTPHCNQKVWWVCPKGHDYEATVGNRNRVKGRGCPYCAGRKVKKEESLAAIHPDLAAQWHPHKNGTFTPWQIKPNSPKKAWWTCRNGHEYLKAIAGRTRSPRGRLCPYCDGNRRKN